MTKEEQWKREAEIKLDELDDRGFDFDNWSISDAYERGFCDCAEPREKRIDELEEKISVLLSCKNCPENKGGFICQKEYEDKCLAQKIQYIKELKEENKVLAQNLEDTEILNKTYEKRFDDLEKENAELKEFYEKEYFEIADRTADEKIKELEKYQTEVTVDDYSPYDENTWGMMHEEMFVPKELVRDLLKESYALSEHRNDQLTKAKVALRNVIDYLGQFCSDYPDCVIEAEKILKEE